MRAMFNFYYTNESPLSDDEFYRVFRSYIRNYVPMKEKEAIRDKGLARDEIFKEYCRYYAASIGESWEKVYRVATIRREMPTPRILRDLGLVYSEVTRRYFYKGP